MDTVELLYLPVADLARSLRFYRDTLGFSEVWREGESTASLQLPGGHLQLMLDEDDGEPSMRPGPMISVDDVRAWHAERGDRLSFWFGPAEIPGGYLAAFEDDDGNAVYVIDQSTADT